MDKSIIHKFVLFIAAICSTFSVSAYDFEVDGIYYDKISDTSVEVTNDDNFLDNNGAGYSGIVTIPETIEINGITYFVCGIGNYAFYGCTGLTSVAIPASVTSIAKGTFRNCTGLASVSIPASVTSIGDDAFRDCTSLTSFTIPEGVTSIGEDSFSGCTGLTSVVIPASVTSIGLSALRDCPCLTEIVINNNNPNYASIDGVLFNKTYTELILCSTSKAGLYNIPEGVTSISLHAFFGCTGLTSVTIPASVTSIGEGAFWGCTGLTSVSIPASVTSIGKDTFWGCTGLTSVSIPEGVTSIDDFAFNYCMALNRVICFADTVPTFGYDVFADVPTTCSFYVPSGTGGSYASAKELASYTIKELGLTVTPAEVTLEVGTTAELTASYTVDGADETEAEISSVLGSEFIWSSSDENVAAVSTSGQVTARNAGTAEIKAITRFGNTVFATSTVNVGTSGILDVSANGIKIRAASGKIMVENIGENQKVSAYTIDGVCQIFQVSNEGTVEIPAETGKIYIIAVDGFATKVIAK